MTSVDLVEILDDLKEDELQRFKWYLKDAGFMKPCKALKESSLEKATRQQTVDLMVKTFKLHGALEVTRKVLEAIPRHDLVQSLQDTISRLEDSRELTIDTNTVNPSLELSDHNREVTRPDMSMDLK